MISGGVGAPDAVENVGDQPDEEEEHAGNQKPGKVIDRGKNPSVAGQSHQIAQQREESAHRKTPGKRAQQWDAAIRFRRSHDLVVVRCREINRADKSAEILGFAFGQRCRTGHFDKPGGSIVAQRCD